MKTRTLIKILLLIAGGLCVVSSIIQSDILEFYVKPTTVPLLFMLYWFNVQKLDPLFVVILLLCFLGDIFLLIEVENSFIYVLGSYILCYLILFYYLVKNHQSYRFNKLDILNLIIILLFLSYIGYASYGAIIKGMGDLKVYGFIYMIILYILFAGAVFEYINSRSMKSLWFLIAIINFVIADTCFGLHKFYVASIELKIINAIYQLLAVYFLIEFKLAKNNILKF